MRQQTSIIDDIKRSIVLKKKLKIKNVDGNFVKIIRLGKVLFNTTLSEQMVKTHFPYQFIDKNGKKQKADFLLKEFNPQKKIMIVTRKGKDGIYNTQLEIAGKKILYFESVLLNEPPFQIWGTVGKINFKRHFQKRIKLLKKEIESWTE